MASLYESFSTSQYWTKDVLVPALGSIILAKLLDRLPPIPRWWALALTGTYAVISLFGLWVAYRSGYVALWGQGKPHPGFLRSWEEYLRISDFVPNYVAAIMPACIVLSADLFFSPLASKSIKLVQVAVVAMSAAFVVYTLATAEWNQSSFFTVSVGEIAAFDVSFLASLLIVAGDFVLRAILWLRRPSN